MQKSRSRIHRAASVLAPAAALLVGSGAFVSCLLSGYEKGEPGAGGSGGAGSTSAVSTAAATTNATTDAGAGGTDLPICETTEYPQGPTGAVPGGAFDQWFALRRLQLGDPDQPAEVPGFDLDRVDSCNEECRGVDPECARPDFLSDLTATQEQERCDWPVAVDNTSVYLFQDAATSLGVTDADLSREADEGSWSLLVRISEWNGTSNDSEVIVRIYSTPGFEPSGGGTTSSSSSSSTGSGATSSGSGGGEAQEPLWNGTDVWSIDARTLEGGVNINAPSFQAEGYITDATLVAQIGGFFFAGSARVPIRLASGRLVAPMILDEPGPPKLREAVFGGRWPVNDLVAALGKLIIGESRLCDQALIYNQVADRACRLVDVTSEDGLGPCSALSFGVRFDAEAIIPGSVIDPIDTTEDCPEKTCDDLLAD